MRRNDTGFVGTLTDDVSEDVSFRRDIQCRGGFIEKQHRGIAEDGLKLRSGDYFVSFYIGKFYPVHLYPEAILCQRIKRGTLRDMDFFWQFYELTDPVRRDGAVEEGRNNRNHFSKRAGKVTPLLQEQRHGSIGNVVCPQTEQTVSECRKLHRTPENRHYDIGFNRKQIIF